MSDFDQLGAASVPTAPEAESDFAGIQPNMANDGSTKPGPLRTGVLAVASAPDTRIDTISSLEEQNLQTVRETIKNQQEFAQRLKLAQQRQEKTMKTLDTLTPTGPLVTPESTQAMNEAYDRMSRMDVAESAKTVAEYDAVGKVQDYLTSGNPVEAKLTYSLLVNGGAEDRWNTAAVKNLIMAQAAERYQSEYEGEGVGSSVMNFIYSLIPTSYNFSRTGVVPGYQSPSAWTGIKNFFLSGTSLSDEGQYMYDKYRDPKDLAAALAPGGELDKSIRSNSSTLGTFNPGTANELLGGLQYLSDSDREWANGWGIADAGTIFATEFKTPWKVGTSIVGAVTRMGARDAGKKLLASGIDDIMKAGETGVIDRLGVSRASATEGLELSGMNTITATNNAIPLGVDADTYLKAADNVLKNDLPENIQTVRTYSPEQQQLWYENAVKAEEARIGQPIKDFKTMVEDVRTGESWQFDPKNIREQGNVINYVEYTVGKKSGGGFATQRSAVNAAKARGLADTDIIYDAVENTWKTADPEFSITGYHGTVGEFDQFDPAFGGKVTQAKSAKDGIFFTDNPDVAWTYAEAAAKDRSVSVIEMSDAGKRYKTATGERHLYKNELAKKYDISVKAADGGPLKPEYFSERDFKSTGKLTEQEQAKLEAMANEYSDARKAYDKAKHEGSVSGQNIRPAKLRLNNPLVYDYKNMLSNSYSETKYSEIIAKAKAEGHDGVILKNTDDAIGVPPDPNFDWEEGGKRGEWFKNHDVYVVFDPENIKAPWDAFKTERDVSGQYFVKARINVRETGFATPPLNTPANNFFSRLTRSSARLLDRESQMKAVASGANADRFAAVLNQKMKESIGGLSKAEKGNLDAILRKGQNVSKWFNERQFDMLYERVAGETPSAKVQKAYADYRLFNDMEYQLRNDEAYKSLVIRGAETLGFDLNNGGARFDGTGFIRESKPTARVYNVSERQHYTDVIPDADWERLTGSGYLHVEARDAVTLADGTTVKNFLIRRSDLERKPLVKTQLGYTEGGHRAYTGTHYAKQATEGIQPDTGKAFLKNPNVFRTSTKPNLLREWADTMNEAIKVAAKGERDPQVYEDIIFGKAKPELGFPTGEEFVKLVEDGRIDLKNPIEVVYDRELPTRYTAHDPNTTSLVDVEETAATGYYRTTGRMYDSKKGEHLLDETGEFAETIDPWETQNQAMYNIARMSSLSNYKSQTVERFKNTFGSFLNLKNLDEANMVDLLRAEPRPGVDANIIKRLKAEQQGISRILGFETEFDRGVRMAHREVADWVLGDATGGIREKGHDFVYWLQKKNPVQFLRTLAFDAKLGLFNIGQFFLQTSTIAASVALHPSHGFAGIRSMVPLFSYVMSNGAENVLDVLAKRSWKAAGFDSEQEFKEFHRFVNKTGFMNVGDTHLLINSFGPNSVYGAAGAVDGIRQKGRAFFFMAEQFNRAVASRIAYNLLKEQGVKLGTAEFREKFIGIADDVTMNMTGESAARFQHGFASIPTQFWAYNMRMMDAMFGGKFTVAQRSRLIASQFLLYGAGGVPVVDALADMWKESDYNKGQPLPIDTIAGTLDRGILDRAIYESFGADVQFGERVGTGSFLTNTVKDLFGMSEYGEKSTIDVLGGATFSITKNTLPVIKDIMYYTYAETGSDQGWQITKDNMLKLAMQISTVSNVTKAMIAYNYGAMISSTGALQAKNLPTADAVWIALGIQPQEMSDASTMSNYLKDKKQSVSDAVKVLRNWRQEAFTIPDKYDENREKANMFVKLLPPDIKNDVLKQVNKTTDESFYDYVAKKYQKQKSASDLTEKVNNTDGE